MEQQLWNLVASERSVEVVLGFGEVRACVFGHLKKQDGKYCAKPPFGSASICFAPENVRKIEVMGHHTIIYI